VRLCHIQGVFHTGDRTKRIEYVRKITTETQVLLLAAVVAFFLKKPDVEDLTEEERRINGLPAEDEDLAVAMPKKGG
jgi:hypothetical protein